MNEEEKQKVEVIFILEMIGKPKEYLVESLEKLIKEMSEEEGVTIKKKTIKDPKVIEEHKGFFTTFAEIEFEADKTYTLILLLFKYMPAHVEITYPENIPFKNHEVNDFLNEIARRLHAYEEVARVITSQKEKMEAELKKLKEEKK